MTITSSVVHVRTVSCCQNLRLKIWEKRRNKTILKVVFWGGGGGGVKLLIDKIAHNSLQ